MIGVAPAVGASSEATARGSLVARSAGERRRPHHATIGGAWNAYRRIAESPSVKRAVRKPIFSGILPTTSRNQCGGAFYGMSVGSVLDRKPLIMCLRKEEVREILESLAHR